MPSSRSSSLAIVGTGPVARTLGRLLVQSSLVPALVIGRSRDSALRAATYIGKDVPLALSASDNLADVWGAGAVMLAVPDRAIASVACDLARLKVIEPGTLVFHCAGALDSSVLAPCAALGALTASVHPLTSFADPDTLVERFAGVFCVSEGNAAALTQLEAVFAALGAHIRRLEGPAKAAYHAGAVLASGYLVATLAAALAAEESAGIDAESARAMLEPLVRTSIDNALKLGARAAMTGPLVRGDDAVVHRHHASLVSSDAALGACYAALTSYAAHVLGRPDPLTPEGS